MKWLLTKELLLTFKTVLVIEDLLKPHYHCSDSGMPFINRSNCVDFLHCQIQHVRKASCFQDAKPLDGNVQIASVVNCQGANFA